jgi:hypothetical protein
MYRYSWAMASNKQLAHCVLLCSCVVNYAGSRVESRQSSLARDQTETQRYESISLNDSIKCKSCSF